jgi:selT/selW/selH-like putative selenoprotein
MADLSTTAEHPVPCPLPRVTIQFCTQCKWLLRAAYVRLHRSLLPPLPKHQSDTRTHPQYAQELLSTFSVSLGEVALQPSTGGTFIVAIHHGDAAEAERKVLWDRKVDGGFPETKELKRRVRDVIEPGRNLGHVDRDHGKKNETGREEDDTGKGVEGGGAQEGGKCEDCS